MELQTSPEAKLNHLAGDAVELEKNSKGFMEPGGKRRGRPKGSTKNAGPNPSGPAAHNGPGSNPTPQPQVDPIAELLPLTTSLTTFYSQFLVQLAEDDKAKLDENTSKTMSHCMAVSLNQYFPNAMGAHASLIVLLCIVGQTSFTAYQLRLLNLAKLRAEAKARQDSMNGAGPRPVN